MRSGRRSLRWSAWCCSWAPSRGACFRERHESASRRRGADPLVRSRPPGRLRRDEGVPRGPGGPPYMTVEESYGFCARVARKQAKNFYYSFLLLSKPRRQAMCAIYAFMRYCDDLSDEAGIADRTGAIANWRRDLEAALAGNLPQHALWPAFADAVQRYRIPHQYFFE